MNNIYQLPPGYVMTEKDGLWHLTAEDGNVIWDPFESKKDAWKAAWEDYEAIFP